jgi:hypothetical protein
MTDNQNSTIQQLESITAIKMNSMKHPAAVIFFFLLLYAFPVSANPISKTTSTGNDTTGNDTTGNDTTGNDTTGNDTTGNDTTGNDTTGNDTIVSPETQSPRHLTYDGLPSIILGVVGLLVSALAIMLGLKYGRMVTLVPGAMSLSPNATVSPANTFGTSLTDISPSPLSDNISAAGHPLGSHSGNQT